jgi:hypothetical protein
MKQTNQYFRFISLQIFSWKLLNLTFRLISLLNVLFLFQRHGHGHDLQHGCAAFTSVLGCSVFYFFFTPGAQKNRDTASGGGGCHGADILPGWL